MSFTNDKLQPHPSVIASLSPVVFGNVRATCIRKSSRKRMCYGTGCIINKGDDYVNHQFRYDGRILTVCFSINYFYNKDQ